LSAIMNSLVFKVFNNITQIRTSRLNFNNIAGSIFQIIFRMSNFWKIEASEYCICLSIVGK